MNDLEIYSVPLNDPSLVGLDFISPLEETTEERLQRRMDSVSKRLDTPHRNYARDEMVWARYALAIYLKLSEVTVERLNLSDEKKTMFLQEHRAITEGYLLGDYDGWLYEADRVIRQRIEALLKGESHVGFNPPHR